MRSVVSSAKQKRPKSSSGVSAKRDEVSLRARTVSKPSIKKSSAGKSSYSKKMKRYMKQGVKSMLLSPMFHSTFRATSAVVVASVLLYTSYSFISKTFANEVVISQGEIISRVAALTPLPQDPPYEIVRVQDEEDLKKQNSFYKDVKEGDYILMYRDMAVIYDLRANTVIGVKRTGEK